MSDPYAERQARLVQVCRVAGVVLTGIALVLIVSGFIGFASGIGSDTGLDGDPTSDSGFGPPTSFWLFVAGLPLLAVGSFCLRVGFFGAATRFAARESTPALRQLRDDLWPAPTPAPPPAPAGARFCGSCGAGRSVDDRFCPGCGKALTPS